MTTMTTGRVVKADPVRLRLVHPRLTNATRVRVLAMIAEVPGVTSSGIGGRLDLAVGVVPWHLGLLAEAKLIVWDEAAMPDDSTRITQLGRYNLWFAQQVIR